MTLNLRDYLTDLPLIAILRGLKPELSRLFAAAAQVAGRTTREIDGETAFLAGARHLAELVQ